MVVGNGSALSCLTNVVAFYDEVTALVGSQRRSCGCHLDFCKACDMVPHNILSKPERY